MMVWLCEGDYDDDDEELDGSDDDLGDDFDSFRSDLDVRALCLSLLCSFMRMC